LAQSNEEYTEPDQSGEEYTEPDWSKLERPGEAPWPFTILFVGVDNGKKSSPDLKLKLEFKKIEQAYRERLAKHDTRRVVIKQLLFSQWKEVMEEICKEMPTALHLGCHAWKGKGGGLELFRQTVKPREILPSIVSWNRDARIRSPPRPEIRLIVLNACESETHAILSTTTTRLISRISLYDRLFDGTTLLDSFNIARSCCKDYRLFTNKDPGQFRLLPVSPQTASQCVSEAVSVAAGSCILTPDTVMVDSDCNELVRFLKHKRLSAIAARFSEVMGMELVLHFGKLQAEDLDDPDLSFLKRWQKQELMELVQGITTGSASLRDRGIDDRVLSGANTASEVVETAPESGDDAESAVDAAVAKHPGNPEDFQEYMKGFIQDFVDYLCIIPDIVDEDTETFKDCPGLPDGIWSYCMLVWIRFAKDSCFDGIWREKWRECIKFPSQDRLLAMLDSCLQQASTSHELWSRAEFERLECSKHFAAAIFVTDVMVRHSLKGHAESVRLWQQDVVKNWFQDSEEASAFLFRANTFLRENVINGIGVVTQVVKMQSYVAFLRMTKLASLLLFEYLDARKLEDTSVSGAKGGSSSPFHGFHMFVSSSSRVLSLTPAEVPALGAKQTVLQGLRCLARLSAQAWDLLGPIKTARDYVGIEHGHGPTDRPAMLGRREGKEKVRALLEEGYLNGPIKPNSKHDKRFLTPSQREALATKTGLTLAQVDTWLHNRWKRDPVKET